VTKSLCTIQWKKGIPTLDDVCASFQLDKSDVDEDFGVVEIDPDDHLYSIMVEESRIAQVDPKWAEVETEEGTLRGPFSNPPVEPFGPPQGEDERED
jgi:hypothetical protein